MRATLSDIAEQTGCSRATVSSILSGGGTSARFSPATRRKVLGAAKRLNYRPRLSQGVGLIYSVGTCDPDEVDWISWISPMLTSIQSRAVEADQLLSVFCYSHQTLGRDIAQGRLPQILRRRHIDGLILSGRIEEELIAHISESRLPYVLMNVSDADSHADDAICFDEIFSGREATRHLIAEGHRRILYLGVDWTPDHYSIGMRRRGYDLAMEEAGLAARHVAIVEDEYSRFAVEFGEVMRGSDRPTAIVCYWECLVMQFNWKNPGRFCERPDSV